MKGRPHRRPFFFATAMPALPRPYLLVLTSRWRAGQLLLTLVLATAGCRAPGREGTASLPGPTPPRVEQAIAALTRDLLALGPGVTEEEAGRFARTAILSARRLATEYRAVRPAWAQNVLVNWGLKPRGLCYQWAEDLHRSLAPLPHRQLALRPVVARRGTSREHNALVVFLVHRPPESGLVLDAWRHGGRLYWAPLRADKYPWTLADAAE